MKIADLNICVIGAGIGGLTAAIALARRGATVTVLEQADEIREVGAGIQISPNGAAVLDALGLADRLAAIGMRAERIELRDGQSGAGVFKLDLTRHDGAYRFVHRADLIDMLAQAARDAGVTISLGKRVEQLKVSEGDVLLADGARIHADLVIGADGIHSVARTAIHGRQAPFFTYQAAWRAVIPAAGAPAPRVQVFMGPGRHMVTYPLRGGAEINIVAVEERREWTDENWHSEDDPEILRKAFSGFCPEARKLLDHVETVHIWGLFRHEVARSWSSGRVALLGDAAHPTLPFLAQGAVMAIEDAWVLADALSDAETLKDALSLYEAHRTGRVKRVVAAATANARNYHLRSPLMRFAAHTALRATSTLAPGLALKKFDWLYAHDVTRAGR